MFFLQFLPFFILLGGQNLLYFRNMPGPQNRSVTECIAKLRCRRTDSRLVGARFDRLIQCLTLVPNLLLHGFHLLLHLRSQLLDFLCLLVGKSQLFFDLFSHSCSCPARPMGQFWLFVIRIVCCQCTRTGKQRYHNYS